MIPVIHVFYANETSVRSFSAIALFPMANGFTNCVQVTHVDAIDEALTQVNRERNKRGIDSRAPLLAHKVRHQRVEDIRRTIRG